MVRLNNERLKFFVGLNTGYATDGKFDDRLIEFYRRRSSPALYCAIIGNVVIPGGHRSNNNTPLLSDAPEWALLANEIWKRGTIPAIQLTTAWEGYIGSRNFRSQGANDVIEKARQLVRELGPAGIEMALSALDRAADMAVKAGFRHLQVHAAHGYLFSLLVDHRFNEYEADVLNRLAAWAARLSFLKIETSIRISLRTGDSYFDEHERDHFYERIACLPFDFIDVSSGFYNIDKRLIYPGRADVLQSRRTETIALATRFPDRRFIFSGRAMLRSDHDLPANVHLGLCRDLIANPDYLVDGSRGCVNSGKCHYFSRGADHITCSQWTDQT